MAVPTIIAVDPPLPHILFTSVLDPGLPILPLDSTVVSEDSLDTDDAIWENKKGNVTLDNLDYNFSSSDYGFASLKSLDDSSDNGEFCVTWNPTWSTKLLNESMFSPIWKNYLWNQTLGYCGKIPVVSEMFRLDLIIDPGGGLWLQQRFLRLPFASFTGIKWKRELSYHGGELAKDSFRRLSKSEYPSVEAALEAGAVPILVQCFSFGSPDEQLPEAAWCLTNIAARKPEETKALLPALPLLIAHSGEKSSLLVAEQCAWALGNVAGEGEELRNVLLSQGALLPLARMMLPNKGSTVRTATWAISNLIKGPNSKAAIELIRIDGVLDAILRHFRTTDEDLATEVALVVVVICLEIQDVFHSYKAITKRMTAIEGMGGMDALCSDKTGTLTLNKLTVDRNLLEVFAKGVDPDTVVLMAARASRIENLDAIDNTIVGMLADPKEARAGNREVHFLPFNPIDKRTALTYTDGEGRWHMVSKGAAEQIRNLAHNNSGAERRIRVVSITIRIVLPSSMVIIIAILNDGTIMTISKDRVKPAPMPDNLELAEILATGTILGDLLKASWMAIAILWLLSFRHSGNCVANPVLAYLRKFTGYKVLEGMKAGRFERREQVTVEEPFPGDKGLKVLHLEDKVKVKGAGIDGTLFTKGYSRKREGAAAQGTISHNG